MTTGPADAGAATPPALDVRPDAGLILDYIAALESIIRSLPGQVTINGRAYSNDAGIAELRRHFDVESMFAVRRAALTSAQPTPTEGRLPE